MKSNTHLYKFKYVYRYIHVFKHMYEILYINGMLYSVVYNILSITNILLSEHASLQIFISLHICLVGDT